MKDAIIQFLNELHAEREEIAADITADIQEFLANKIQAMIDADKSGRVTAQTIVAALRAGEL